MQQDEIPKIKITQRKRLPLVIFGIIFAGIGSYVIINSFAATETDPTKADAITGTLLLSHLDEFRNKKAVDNNSLLTNDGYVVPVDFGNKETSLSSGTQVTLHGKWNGKKYGVSPRPKNKHIKGNDPAQGLDVDIMSGPQAIKYNKNSYTKQVAAKDTTASTLSTVVLSGTNDTLYNYPASPKKQLTGNGVKRVGVIMANFSNRTSNLDYQGNPITSSTVLSQLNNLNQYLTASSGGQLSLSYGSSDVYGWYTLKSTAYNCLDAESYYWDNEAYSTAINNGADLSKYDLLVYVYPYNSQCNWGGYGYYGLGHATLNGDVTLRVLAHELGHNIDYGHAASYICSGNIGKLVSISGNCTYYEYGDPYDAMGANTFFFNYNTNAYILPQYDSYRKSKWWFDQIKYTRQINSNTDVFLENSESPPSTLPKLIKIPRSKNGIAITEDGAPQYLWIDLKTPTSSDAFLGNYKITRGVTVRVGTDLERARSYLVDSNPSAQDNNFYDAPMSNGQTLYDPDTKVSITQVGSSSDGSVVSLSIKFGVAPFSEYARSSDLLTMKRYWNASIRDWLYDTSPNFINGAYGYNYDSTEAYTLKTQLPGSLPFKKYWNPTAQISYYTTADRQEGLYGYYYSYTIGYIYPTQQPNTVPLYYYYNEGATTYFYTITRNDSGYGQWGYKYNGIAGYVYPQSEYSTHFYSNNRDDTARAANGYKYNFCIGFVNNYGVNGSVPLYDFYNSSKTDHVLTQNSSYAANNSGYTLQATAGYVYPTQANGTVPLKGYFNSIVNDHLYTTDPNFVNGAYGYGYYGTIGYVIPPSSDQCKND